MTGWGADGRTRPTWRSCAHLYMDGDRCDTCKARRVHAEQNERPAGGGIPLGSPLLVRPDLPPMHKAGPERVTTYNGQRKA